MHLLEKRSSGFGPGAGSLADPKYQLSKEQNRNKVNGRVATPAAD